MLFAAAIILLTSYIILQTCLLKQVVIEFYNAVAKGQALRLNRFAYLRHDVRCKMAGGRRIQPLFILAGIIRSTMTKDASI